jgi:hypothetical protein
MVSPGPNPPIRRRVKGFSGPLVVAGGAAVPDVAREANGRIIRLRPWMPEGATGANVGLRVSVRKMEADNLATKTGVSGTKVGWTVRSVAAEIVDRAEVIVLAGAVTVRSVGAAGSSTAEVVTKVVAVGSRATLLLAGGRARPARGESNRR